MKQVLHRPAIFAGARQRFLKRNAFDFSGFDFRDATVSFSFPRRCNRWLNAAVAGSYNAVNQFRDNFLWHFAGFFYDLIERNRHD